MFAPFSISSPLSLNVIKLRVWLDHTSFTCDNLASISFSFTDEMQMSYKWKKAKLRRVKNIISNIVIWDEGKLQPQHPNCQHTSISSLYFNRGASMIFFSVKVLDSTSNGCPVRSVIRSQCLFITDLFTINSSRGHDSMKSSIVFFRSWKACQLLSPLGSFRHLDIEIIIDLGQNIQTQVVFVFTTYIWTLLFLQQWNIYYCINLGKMIVLERMKAHGTYHKKKFFRISIYIFNHSE